MNFAGTTRYFSSLLGKKALIQIANINPDLLIADLDMTGVDGFELLGLLRQNPQFAQCRYGF